MKSMKGSSTVMRIVSRILRDPTENSERDDGLAVIISKTLTFPPSSVLLGLMGTGMKVHLVSVRKQSC